MIAASRKTVAESLEVMRRYLTETQIREVLLGLLAVKANRCFRLTIRDLCDLVELDPKEERAPVHGQTGEDHARSHDG